MRFLRGLMPKQQRGFARHFQANSALRRLMVGLLFLAVVASVFTTSILPERVDLSVGQVADRDIKAPRTVINEIETERLRKAAADAVDPVYEHNSRVGEEALASLQSLFTFLQSVRAQGELSLEQRLERLKENEIYAELPDEILMALLQEDGKTMASVYDESERILSSIMQSGIKAETLDSFRRQVDVEVDELPLSPNHKTAMSYIIKSLIKPNLVFNQEETMKRRQQAREAVEPVQILEGEIVVAEGRKVTEEDIAILRQLGLLRSESSTRVTAGALLLSLIYVLVIAAYLYYFQREVFESERMLLLLCIILSLLLIPVRMFIPISAYLVPVGAATLLLSILLNPRLAVFAGFMLALAVGILTGNDFKFMLVAFIGGMVGVYSVERIGQRSDLVKTGLAIGAANALTILTLYLAFESGSLLGTELLLDLLYGLVSGALAAVLAVGSLPFFENSFGIITAVKLLELSNPDQPLLRQLLLEAPGTYHHSVLVANLSEAATEAVGGDSLLARVGAYYHDIGKMKRPYFFIENQFGGQNPHEKISPSLSALIITSHVKDGVELAREHKLPSVIVDFIREHHGTTCISYFFNRAAEADRGNPPTREDFSYDGPKPTSKESAVVMLADSAEAAVRALSKPTPGRIEGVIRKVIKDRLNDNQLEKCDLTLKNLDTIADIFTKILTGVFHPRIEYPEGLKGLEKEPAEKEQVAGPAELKEG